MFRLTGDLTRELILDWFPGSRWDLYLQDGSRYLVTLGALVEVTPGGYAYRAHAEQTAPPDLPAGTP